MSRQDTEKDKELLYALSKHPGYEVLKRGLENLREDIHLQLEHDSTEKDIFYHQGEINGIKSVVHIIEKATARLKKAEEQQKIEEEVITNN